MSERRLDSEGILQVPATADDATDFWRGWFLKWRCRIEIAERATEHRDSSRVQRRVKAPTHIAGRAGRRPRVIKAADVVIAWKRLFMPAVDVNYVMPEWWLQLSNDQKRRKEIRPSPVPQLRRVRSARGAPPGFSLDDAGAYLKHPSGRVFRDRASAAAGLWRYQANSSIADLIDWLPSRKAGPECRRRVVRAREPGRVLEALVCFGLVAAGHTRVGAAKQVLGWSGRNQDPIKHAGRNLQIWRELRLPL